MNKIAIAASALSLGGVAVAGYYVSPSGHTAEGVEPILIEVAPESVAPQLRDLRVLRFIRQFGGNNSERELRAMGDNVLWETMKEEGDGTFVLKAKFLDDEALIIRAIVTPVAGGRSSVDVNVEIPDNRFITSDRLHPADRQTLAAMVEVVATEYVSSVLNRQKMASTRELEPLMKHASGMTDDELKALGERMEGAFEESYKDQLYRLVPAREGRSQSAWDRELRDRANSGGFAPEELKPDRRRGW